MFTKQKTAGINITNVRINNKNVYKIIINVCIKITNVDINLNKHFF